MTSERLLNAIAAYLRPKVVAAGGVFELSADVANTLSLLATSAGRLRVVLQWQRESKTENRAEREMTFLVIVQHGISTLGINSGDGVSVTRPASLSGSTADDAHLTADASPASFNNAPLLMRCTQVCAWVRALIFSNTEITRRFPACEAGNAYWLNDASFPTKQIAHEFAVRFTGDIVTAVEVAA